MANKINEANVDKEALKRLEEIHFMVQKKDRNLTKLFNNTKLIKDGVGKILHSESDRQYFLGKNVSTASRKSTSIKSSKKTNKKVFVVLCSDRIIFLNYIKKAKNNEKLKFNISFHLSFLNLQYKGKIFSPI